MTRSPGHLDDTELTLIFYGAIIYLAVVAALGSQTTSPPPQVAISTLVATATVLYMAHVFTSLVPKAARAGKLHARDFRAALAHELPLVLTAIVPILPLALAALDVVDVETGYQLSVRLSIGLLFILAVSVSRRDGLTWGRALVAGAVIIVIAVVVITLESMVH
jgi:hypothetical protein